MTIDVSTLVRPDASSFGGRVTADARGATRLPSPSALTALGFALLTIISLTSVWLVIRERSDALAIADVAGSTEQQEFMQLELLLQETENDHFRYLLDGEPAALDKFLTDAEAVTAALARVSRSATAQRQPDLTNTLEELVHRWLSAMRGAVRARQQNDADSISYDLQTNEYLQELLHRIESVTIDATAEESGRLRTRTAESQLLNDFLLGFSLVGAVVVVVLATAMVMMMRRSTAALKRAHGELERINASLEATVASRTEELREANEEVQRFAYIVSHDLRSPLVNIMGFTSELDALCKNLFTRLAVLRQQSGGSEAAQDAALRDEFQEALRFIKTSIARMEQLISAMLRLSRDGKRELQPVELDMSELVRSVAEAFAHRANTLGATISIGSLPLIVSDRFALEQIFSNLLDNALKYLRDDVPGKIVIEGETTADQVVYTVRDNGRGIAEKDLERIFELFRRSGAQDVPGEGIGLTYVRMLAQRLGGKIDVTSSIGEGATFTISLPHDLNRAPS